MLGAQEARVLAEFCRQYELPFKDLSLLKLALTHRSYLSVTGQGPRESNERLEFLGDSVLGLVTSEFLYRRHPDEHEGQLTKTKSLLVSKAILSRRALRIGLGRFVLMSHSEVESGGRQRLSILADAFESVIGAIYLDQGFESARSFIHQHLLSESDAITSDKRHTNYKSHLQEYVQNSFRTHPVYRIRSEYGPDHSKYFMVEVMVGKRTLGEGRGHNKKEAEQAAARDALEKVEKLRRKVRDDDDRTADTPRERGSNDPDERGERGSSERGERGSSERGERGSSERSSNERGERSSNIRGRRASAVAPPPPPETSEVEGGEEEEEAASRRRRGRRGGRTRHGREDAPRGAREPEAERADSPMRLVEPAVVAEEVHHTSGSDDDIEGPDSIRASLDDAMLREFTGPVTEVAAPTLESVDAPSPLASSIAPVAPAPTAPAARPMSFGRGRRRDAPAAPAPSASPVSPAPAVPAVERSVDPFEPAAPIEPTPKPVVDVAADTGAPETEREREARIDEMERALENFGRRRNPDSGRRGRRR